MFASGFGLAQTDSASNAPSLGDLARQQQHGKRPEKVFTDEDLPSRSSVEDQTRQVGSRGAGPAGTADSAVKSAEKPEKADKSAAADTAGKKPDATPDVKKQLDRYTTERDAWKQAAKRYEDLLVNEKDDFRRQSYEDALSKDRHNAELYQAKIDEIQASQSKPQADQSADASANGGGHK